MKRCCREGRWTKMYSVLDWRPTAGKDGEDRCSWNVTSCMDRWAEKKRKRLLGGFYNKNNILLLYLFNYEVATKASAIRCSRSMRRNSRLSCTRRERPDRRRVCRTTWYRLVCTNTRIRDEPLAEVRRNRPEHEKNHTSFKRFTLRNKIVCDFASFYAFKRHIVSLYTRKISNNKTIGKT